MRARFCCRPKFGNNILTMRYVSYFFTWRHLFCQRASLRHCHWKVSGVCSHSVDVDCEQIKLVTCSKQTMLVVILLALSLVLHSTGHEHPDACKALSGCTWTCLGGR